MYGQKDFNNDRRRRNNNNNNVNRAGGYKQGKGLSVSELKAMTASRLMSTPGEQLSQGQGGASAQQSYQYTPNQGTQGQGGPLPSPVPPHVSQSQQHFSKSTGPYGTEHEEVYNTGSHSPSTMHPNANGMEAQPALDINDYIHMHKLEQSQKRAKKKQNKLYKQQQMDQHYRGYQQQGVGNYPYPSTPSEFAYPGNESYQNQNHGLPSHGSHGGPLSHGTYNVRSKLSHGAHELDSISSVDSAGSGSTSSGISGRGSVQSSSSIFSNSGWGGQGISSYPSAQATGELNSYAAEFHGNVPMSSNSSSSSNINLMMAETNEISSKYMHGIMNNMSSHSVNALSNNLAETSLSGSEATVTSAESDLSVSYSGLKGVDDPIWRGNPVEDVQSFNLGILKSYEHGVDLSGINEQGPFVPELPMLSIDSIVNSNSEMNSPEDLQVPARRRLSSDSSFDSTGIARLLTSPPMSPRHSEKLPLGNDDGLVGMPGQDKDRDKDILPNTANNNNNVLNVLGAVRRASLGNAEDLSVCSRSSDSSANVGNISTTQRRRSSGGARSITSQGSLNSGDGTGTRMSESSLSLGGSLGGLVVGGRGTFAETPSPMSLKSFFPEDSDI